MDFFSDSEGTSTGHAGVLAMLAGTLVNAANCQIWEITPTT